MACCAFAVFLLGQIAFALERVRTFVFGERVETEPAPNPAVSWSPRFQTARALEAATWPMSGNPPSRTSRLRRMLSPQLIALAVTVELVMGMGGLAYAASQSGYTPTDLAEALAMICRGGQLASL